MSRRYVVFGAGAIGGLVGGRLAQSGHDVALIARGPHLEAIRREGLTLITPAERVTQHIPVAADPAELGVGRDGDVVLLAVKSQHTLGALDQLRAARADDVPIVCLQNGVANERVVLRRYSAVYGAVVLCPANHIEPGIVEGSGATVSGTIEIGVYPSGEDALCHEFAEALERSRWEGRVLSRVMPRKYDKLLGNLGNAVGALFAAGPARDELARRVKAEGRAVLDAAGVEHPAGDEDVTARWKRIGVGPIEGRQRGGSSTWQSLARSFSAVPPSVETDYLNGEIVLLARLYGIDSPLNAALCRIADDHVRAGRPPESLDAADLLGQDLR